MTSASSSCRRPGGVFVLMELINVTGSDLPVSPCRLALAEIHKERRPSACPRQLADRPCRLGEHLGSGIFSAWAEPIFQH